MTRQAWTYSTTTPTGDGRRKQRADNGSRAAEALSLIRRGNATNDQNLINRGQDILNQFVILSPGLAAINFDTGMVMEDLQRLANSSDPRIRLLHNQIQNALQFRAKV